MTKTIGQIIADQDREEAFLFVAECDSGVQEEKDLTDEQLVAVKELAETWSNEIYKTDNPNLAAMQRLTSDEARKRFFKAGIAYDSFWDAPENYIKPPSLAAYRDLFIEVFVEAAYKRDFFDSILALPSETLTGEQRSRLLEARDRLD